ncbi:MAG: cytochrome c [Desulfuromonas sp.]|uniref:cytochrome c n=1 Tax=Desulfuromonas sp. TaxID=892 RepID=UPI000CC2246B|nr:cytochrome c [Desulfuromonas sp.]PLX82365.1 MAG: cytochrome c [Desulfuromonas sp.]
MAFKKRDWIFIVLVLGVFGTFYALTGEEKTSKVPYDDIHAKFYPIVKDEGKKAAEKFCKECHGPDGIAFSAEHPDPIRCLFCHKLLPR